MIFKKTNKANTLKKQPEKTEQLQTSSIEQFNNAVDNSFFYTNDKKLNSIDDSEIIYIITKYYPQFNQQTKDSILKKTLLEILKNNAFVEALLKQFDLSVHDFFAILYKQYSSLFNALFIKKVKDILRQCSYANCKE